MTDYILALDKIRNKFIDKSGEELSVPESFGLASPTVERQTKKVKEELDDSPAVNGVFTAYDNDTGNYGDVEKYSYQIQPGDTLSKISREANMSIPQIINMNKGNPAIKSSDLIYAGGNINLSGKVKTKAEIINYDTKPAAILTEEGNVSRIMYEMAEKYNLPFNLVMAVGQKESGLNPYTVAGDKGTALGLMQVRGLALKDVNKHYGLGITRDEQNPKSKNYDIRKSIESGIAYLALQRDKYGVDENDYRSMLAQYNGGPTGTKKKQALNYADSVLGLMQNVKPFDFDAKFTTGEKTPPGEIDSYAVEADNNFREVENANVKGVDYSLLSHATNAIKGVKNEIMPNLDLISTASASTTNELINSLNLSDNVANGVKEVAKEIQNSSNLFELREKIEKLKEDLSTHQENLVNFTGEVKDDTLKALGSGGSAESGMIGFSGQGEFRPDLSGAAKSVLNSIKGAGQNIKDFFTVDPDELVDLDGKGTMATRKEIVNAYKEGDILLGALIDKKQKKERTIDEKMGVSLDNIKTAGFSFPSLNLGAVHASTPKNNEIDASLVLDKELNDSSVLNILDKGWDAALDYVPPNVRLYVNDLLTPEGLKGILGPFTEKHLSDDYKRILGEIAVETLKNHPRAKGTEIGSGLSAPINYDDYKSKKSLEKDDPYADVKYASKEKIDLSDKRFPLVKQLPP